jgi:ABC-type branched-subunit amino acid transport system ATPase component
MKRGFIMVKQKTKIFTVLGISAALLVGAGSTYAAQKEKNESVKTLKSLNKIKQQKKHQLLKKFNQY